MISKFIIFSFLLITVQLISQDLSPNDFVTTWKTDNPGDSNDNQITIPTDPALIYNYNVDWNNDGIFDEFGITGNIVHTFNSPGTYTIRINGDFPRIYFYDYIDNRKIVSINQWGNQAWTSMRYAFRGCRQLQGNATDVPNLSDVTDMSYMFFFAENFNQNINNWDTSNVTNMERTFSQAIDFNQPLDNWDTSNVTNMYGMFYGANSFNQSLNSWDTSNVTNMRTMFFSADSFNGDIGNWDTSNVTEISSMFFEATNFNKPIGNWNTSNITDMSDLFSYASSFNQNIGNWDISNVTSLHYTFHAAESFNQPLDNWDTSNVTDMFLTFGYATSFNQDLGNWNTANVTNMSNMFREARAFNGYLRDWDTSNVTNMSSMFYSADDFNQDISGWNTSNVSQMDGMFYSANSFNQDISEWDTSNVFITNGMFAYATSFDQNIGNWNISSLTSAEGMFVNVTLSTENYDALLIGWEAQPHNNNVVFHGGESIPDLGLPARENLALGDGWQITDGAGAIGVTDYKFEDVEIYPNPSDGIFNIQIRSTSLNPTLSYSVTSLTGQIVIEEKQVFLNKSCYILDLSQINPGLYFIKLTSGATKSIKKLIIN